ncbi:MAG: hypothetical protein ACT6QM_15865, partial [Brevundimonas mediterranea]|uniref:hypothetical protein n=1 Tax=Brevundimonas mediterranea TaxID=74329 RepID=UPI004034A3D9
MAEQPENGQPHGATQAAAMAAEKLAMLKFVDLDQSYPPKRAADARAEDFDEISDRFDGHAAQEQSAR